MDQLNESSLVNSEQHHICFPGYSKSMLPVFMTLWMKPLTKAYL